VNEVELVEPYGGYALGTRFAVVRRHLYAPFLTVAPLDRPGRGLPIPSELLREVG
jgi:hypothetical protein